jgi:DNA helicase II / ATP-dependent DNA helicase PcrA
VPFRDPEETPAEQQQIHREQRRLFYVAMTRPTEILVLSSFLAIDNRLAFQIGATLGRPRAYGALRHTIASPFLSELGPATPAAKAGTNWEANGYV